MTRVRQEGTGGASQVGFYDVSVQVAVGLVCVLFGVLHFADRDRPNGARRAYYLGYPSSATGRGALATLEVAVGFVLLFTA